MAHIDTAYIDMAYIAIAPSALAFIVMVCRATAYI